jgi:hypothetical protein
VVLSVAAGATCGLICGCWSNVRSYLWVLEQRAVLSVGAGATCGLPREVSDEKRHKSWVTQKLSEKCNKSEIRWRAEIRGHANIGQGIYVHDFRLPPRCKRDLSSYGMLRSL